jgi:hypothetical protein
MPQVQGSIVTENGATFFVAKRVGRTTFTVPQRYQIFHDQYNLARAIGNSKEYICYAELYRSQPDPRVMLGMAGIIRLLELPNKDLPAAAMSVSAHPPATTGVAVGPSLYGEVAATSTGSTQTVTTGTVPAA